MIKDRKNFLRFSIGIFFCIICIVCFSILIYTIVYSLSEKTRLEAIGATVNLKFTWLFFVDILAIIISGIIGIKLICSKGKTNLITSEDSMSLKEDVIYKTYDDRKENHAAINIESKKHDAEVKINSELKINNGLSKASYPIKNNDTVRHSEDEPSNSSTGSGFFSSGGDL